MPSKDNREYRSMELRIAPHEDGAEPSFFVEGYASTFEPYVLFRERIEPTAFDEADVSDVVFRVDHQGPVYARTSAGTVELWHDDHGLGQRTNLGKTQRARELFAEIEAGNYPQMSFAFSVADGGDDSIDNAVALCPNCHRKMHTVNLDEDVKKLLRAASMG